VAHRHVPGGVEDALIDEDAAGGRQIVEDLARHGSARGRHGYRHGITDT
jgi:hypothetical protein